MPITQITANESGAEPKLFASALNALGAETDLFKDVTPQEAYRVSTRSLYLLQSSTPTSTHYQLIDGFEKVFASFDEKVIDGEAQLTKAQLFAPKEVAELAHKLALIRVRDAANRFTREQAAWLNPLSLSPAVDVLGTSVEFASCAAAPLSLHDLGEKAKYCYLYFASKDAAFRVDEVRAGVSGATYEVREQNGEWHSATKLNLGTLDPRDAQLAEPSPLEVLKAHTQKGAFWGVLKAVESLTGNSINLEIAQYEGGMHGRVIRAIVDAPEGINPLKADLEGKVFSGELMLDYAAQEQMGVRSIAITRA